MPLEFSEQQPENDTIPGPPCEVPAPAVTRRYLVRLGWIGAALLVVGGQIWVLLKLFFTPQPSAHSAGVVAAGNVAAFPVDGVKQFWKDHFILVRRQSDFLALSQDCTHQKCYVHYLPEQRLIHCPCHGAQFDLNGEVLAGPAPRPLDRFATSIRDGQLFVDTSQRLRATSGSG